MLGMLTHRASNGHVGILHLELLMPLESCHVLIPIMMLVLLRNLVEVLHGWPSIWRHLRVGRTILHALCILGVEFGLPPLTLTLAHHDLIHVLLCVLRMSIDALICHAVHYRVCCHRWASLIRARGWVPYYGCSMRHGRGTIHEGSACATGWLAASLMAHSNTSRSGMTMLHCGSRPCWTAGISLTRGSKIHVYISNQWRRMHVRRHVAHYRRCALSLGDSMWHGMAVGQLVLAVS